MFVIKQVYKLQVLGNEVIYIFKEHRVMMFA